MFIDRLTKLSDFITNHKFRGGLLGIIQVTTASEDVTTARRMHLQWKPLPLQVHTITTAW